MKNSKRPFKGKSLLMFPDNYTVIDLETTGFDPQFDEIIEMSAIKVRDNKIVDTFSQLVNCTNEINDFIVSLTGITKNDTNNAEETEIVLKEFISFIGEDIIIGHNVNFDINFLYDNTIKYFNKPIRNDYVDTLRIARYTITNLKHHRLENLCEFYNIDYMNAHRALSDAEITLNVYIKLKNEFNNFDFEKYTSKNYTLKAHDIVTDKQDFDITNPLYDKRIVFTGTLEKMARKEAMQIVANLGGINQDNVNKETNYLVLGNNDYCKNIKNGKSNKQKKAEQLKIKGQDIEIISENVFYDMIEE